MTKGRIWKNTWILYAIWVPVCGFGLCTLTHRQACKYTCQLLSLLHINCINLCLRGVCWVHHFGVSDEPRKGRWVGEAFARSKQLAFDQRPGLGQWCYHDCNFTRFLRLFERTLSVSKRKTSEYPRCHSSLSWLLILLQVESSIVLTFRRFLDFFKSTFLSQTMNHFFLPDLQAWICMNTLEDRGRYRTATQLEPLKIPCLIGYYRDFTFTA